MTTAVKHDVIKPGSLWKSSHPMFLPRDKISTRNYETTLMLVDLKNRRYEAVYRMNYIEAIFLTEEGNVERLKVMNEVKDSWVTEFYYYCDLVKESTSSG